MIIFLPVCVMLLSACERQNEKADIETPPPLVTLEKTGYLKSNELQETSGFQASFSNAGAFFVHNDDGKPLVYVIDKNGNDLGSVSISSGENRDWEDITSIPVESGRWLVLGDIGDNFSKQQHITLYFIQEPQPEHDGLYRGQLDLKHKLELTYPDGARDCESLAYDPVGNRILLLSKRDKPAHLYAVDLQTALSQDHAVLEFLGTIWTFRKPAVSDRVKWGGKTEWISQPTGLDISDDGKQAVVITYRSLYRFQRQADEDWYSAFQRKPEEVVGPPGPQNEAIAFSKDGKSIFVVSEKRPAPVFHFQFRDAQ